MTTQYLSVEQIIGHVVVLLRRPHFKSQAACSRACRVSPRALSRIETGASMASALPEVFLDALIFELIESKVRQTRRACWGANRKVRDGVW